MLLVRKRLTFAVPYQRCWECGISRLTLALRLAALTSSFFMRPRATPAARLALGAAFLRAARFSFLRSTLS